MTIIFAPKVATGLSLDVGERDFAMTMPRRWLQDSAQGLPWVTSLDVRRGSLRYDLCPEDGYRTQPRVSTLGTLKINQFALKGREADQINLAPVAAQKLECAIEACDNLEPIFVRLIHSTCRLFRARRSGWRFPGLKPWAEPSSPFRAKTSRRDFLQMSNRPGPLRATD
jgi:hypothetical protein